MEERILHRGVIKYVGKDYVKVLILQASACSGCAAKKLCSSADSKEKLVEVSTDETASFSMDEEVTLWGKLKDARWATVLAYVIPLLLLVTTLLILLYYGINENLAALISLGVLLPYYLVLYCFRKRLQRTFSFTITK